MKDVYTLTVYNNADKYWEHDGTSIPRMDMDELLTILPIVMKHRSYIDIIVGSQGDKDDSEDEE